MAEDLQKLTAELKKKIEVICAFVAHHDQSLEVNTYLITLTN